jgi:hypothetical protein
MKSGPNLIFYLHKIFWNFSHFLSICFELFSFGMIFNSEIADSGPHLSDAACRAGPAWQRPVAAWLPRAARLARASPATAHPRAHPDSAAPHAAILTAAVRSRIARAASPLARRRRAAPPSPRR